MFVKEAQRGDDIATPPSMQASHMHVHNKLRIPHAIIILYYSSVYKFTVIYNTLQSVLKTINHDVYIMDNQYYSNDSMTIYHYVCMHTENMTHVVNVINYILNCVSSLDQ